MSLTYVKNANQLFDEGRYLMCTDNYKTVQYLTRVVALLNYPIKRLVVLIRPNRPINSCLDTLMEAVDEVFMLAWANPDLAKANSVHCNNHALGLYCTQPNKMIFILFNDTAQIIKAITTITKISGEYS